MGTSSKKLKFWKKGKIEEGQAGESENGGSMESSSNILRPTSAKPEEMQVPALQPMTPSEGASFPQYVDITQSPWGSYSHGASIVNYGHPAHAAKQAQQPLSSSAPPMLIGAKHKKNDSATTLQVANNTQNNKTLATDKRPQDVRIMSPGSQTKQSDHISVLTDPTGFYAEDEGAQSDVFGSNVKTPPRIKPALPPISDSSLHGSHNSHLLSPGALDLDMTTSPGAPPNKNITPRQNNRASLLMPAMFKQQRSSQGNWLTRSRAFKKLVQWAFDQIDDDGSGHVDRKELYTGLLLIHLELAKYVGAAACKPMQKTQVYALFDKLDSDRSGTLSKDEFTAVMVIMCSQLLSRVIILFGSTIFFVPLLTRMFVEGSIHLWTRDDFEHLRQQLLDIWENMIVPNFLNAWTLAAHHLDQAWIFTYTAIAPLVMKNATKPPELNWDTILDFSQNHTPHIVLEYWDKLVVLWNTHVVPNIPDNFAEALPYTITSCLLASFLVPWLLVQIDNTFESVANRRSRLNPKA